MDDTNPAKEEVEYVDSIIEDVRWLIDGWADRCLGLKPRGQTAGSDGRERQAGLRNRAVARRSECTAPSRSTPPITSTRLHEYAVELIKLGKAYVCDLSPEETEAYRGAPDRPGRDSPFRTRTVEENLDLFARMRAGEFPERRAHPARKDRHGRAEYLDARPGALPHPPHGASSYRQ